MSGLTAIFHADGRPVDGALLARMTRAVAHRGSDGGGLWSDGPVGLGHRLLFTTPESLSEAQPASDRSGQCRIVWDGRIDNRAELLAALGDAETCGTTDPELLLAAYLRWGTECLPRVLGDFAFALWDARRARLFCGRDRLGLKPFHYTWDGRTLLVSSEAGPLALARDGMPEPDDEMVLAYLLREFRAEDHARTFFHGIHRLPPAHCLVADAGGIAVGRYWTIDPAVEIAYARDEEYVEHFRALFAAAVRCRLRSYFPLGLLLSGGLDSSAIAAESVGVAGADGDPVPPLETFTLYSEAPDADERVHARRVVEAGGLKGHELEAGPADPWSALDRVVDAEGPAVGVGRAHDERNIEAIRARGCRVLLTGEGGDQLLDEVGCLADLLWALKPLRFLRDTRALARWYGVDAGVAASMAAHCLVPPAATYWGKRLLRGVPPPWLNRDLASSVGLRERVRAPRVPGRFRSFAQMETCGQITSPYFVLKLEIDERWWARRGMEARYPFLDNRLVEFVAAVPSTRRTLGGERKRLLRAAMRGRLPDAVLGRRGKGDWTDSTDEGLRALCRRIPAGRIYNESGRMERYVDLRAAAALTGRYLNGEHRLRWEVWSLLTLDAWLARIWRRS